jgi:hypothetical protein
VFSRDAQEVRISIAGSGLLWFCIGKWFGSCYESMTRDVIETAKLEAIPFSIKMADGRQYRVDRAEQIHIAKTHVVVIDQKTLPHILPLLTITGLSYEPPKKSTG